MTSLAAQPATERRSETPELPRRKVRRVLLLTHRLPYPPDRGDRIRSFNMLKLLSRHFEVGIACTSEENVWLQHHQLLNTIAHRVAIQPISNTHSKIRSATALLTGKPITPYTFFRQGLADTIVQWHEQEPFDAIMTVCTGMVAYARLLIDPRYTRRHSFMADLPTPRHVLDLMDVDSVKWATYAKQSWPPMSWLYGAEARRLRRVEAGRYDSFDALTVVSEAEAQAYRDYVGQTDKLHAIGNGVDLDYFAPQDDPGPACHNICFVGVLNYRPNADGVTWFAQHVMPLLRQHVPDATLQIVGRHPTPKIEELANIDGVDVVGSVPDVRSYIQPSAAVVAPLRIARGVQNKVLEAMACQRVVVCSPEAHEGIDAIDGEQLLVARQPEQWVAQLRDVFDKHERRHRIAAAARQCVERTYSWEQRLGPLVDLVAGEHVER